MASGSVSQIAGLHRLQMNFDPGVSDFVRKLNYRKVQLACIAHESGVSEGSGLCPRGALWSGPESSDREQLQLRRENEGTQEQIREKI